MIVETTTAFSNLFLLLSSLLITSLFLSPDHSTFHVFVSPPHHNHPARRPRRRVAIDFKIRRRTPCASSPPPVVPPPHRPVCPRFASLSSQCHRYGGTGSRLRGHGPGGRSQDRQVVIISCLARRNSGDGVSRGDAYNVPQGVKKATLRHAQVRTYLRLCVPTCIPRSLSPSPFHIFLSSKFAKSSCLLKSFFVIH